jgi:hypothetical protein
MGTIVAIVSVFLALVAAGCIAYIAWELTSEGSSSAEPDDDQPPESN